MKYIITITMKKTLIIILFIIPLFVKAQYTPIVCGPGLSPSVNYVFVGSLSMDPSNTSNSQKLQIDVLGGDFYNTTKGVTTYYIANRGGLSVNQVSMGGSTTPASPVLFQLAAFQSGSTTNFYLAVNSSTDYYSFAVRAYSFGYTLTGAAVSITTQTAVPSGTNISSSLNIKPVLITDDNGNIGLGTLSPDAAYRLSVNGKIRAKEIRVETGWADYVFEKGYELLPLGELRKYIARHHHLPDVPSAAEIAKNGVSLGQSTEVLLRKLEELTLYMIAKDKELEAERLTNKRLEARVRALEKKQK